MIYKLKKIANIILNRNQVDDHSKYEDFEFLAERITNYGISTYIDFSYDKIKSNTLKFVDSMKVHGAKFEYTYSPACSTPNVYSSAFACMIYSMFGKLDDLMAEEKQEWAQYLNSFQCNKDGLFYDESLNNENYNDCDWWGARHLAVHLINAFVALGVKTKYPFTFLEAYYDVENIQKWLNSFSWNDSFSYENDIDNKIMNIAVLLQYQRDYWYDEKAGQAVKFIQTFLLSKINPDTGMWGYYDIGNKTDLSRMVQFAYHLFPIFFYDSIDIGNKEKIIDLTLKTQNNFGGFGIKLNSSACEDIDSIDILIRFSKNTLYKNKEVDMALKRSFIWVLANQNDDGGYVFRRNEPFFYGHEQMSSGKNESAMFPTWFRTLTIAYLSNYSSEDQFHLVEAPGY